MEQRLILVRKKFCLTAFSLVELMVVVAISAALMAVAIPNYKDYVNKAKVTEMIAAIDPCQTQLYQYFLKNGSFPDGSSADQIVSCQGKPLNSSPTQLRGKISASYFKGTNYAEFIVNNSDLKSSAGDIANLHIRLTIDSGGDITFSCGWPSSEANGVPIAIMPSSCTNNMT